MKRIFTLICLAVICCAFAEDFDFSFAKGLSGWQKNCRSLSVDLTGGPAGNAALKMESKGHVAKTITLEPDAEYEVSVYIKAKDVSGEQYKGVLLRLTDGNNYFAVTGDAKNLPRQGTFDWTKCTRILRTSFFKKSEILVMPALTCEGTVWFADLKIVKKAKSADSAVETKPSQVRPAPAEIKAADENDFAFAPGLPGWQRNSRNVAFDSTEKISGEGSLRLGLGGSVERTVRIEHDAEYEVSVYIKAQDVNGGQYKGVLLRLTDGDRYFAVTGDAKNIPRQGTFDWVKCTRTLKGSFFKNREIRVMPVLTCDGTAWFDDLKIGKKKIAEKGENSFRRSFGEAVEKVALIPEGCFGFFDPGQQISFKLQVRSSSKVLEYALTVKDDAGREVHRQPRRKLEERFYLPGQTSGYYVVEAEIFADGKKAYWTQSAFVVNTSVARRDAFFQFGYGALPEMIPAIKRIGVGSIVLKMHFLQKPDFLKKTPQDANDLFWKTYRAFLEEPDFVLCAHVGCTLSSAFRSQEEFKAGWPLQNDQVLKHTLDCVDLIHKSTRERVREWSIGCEIPSNATGGSKKDLCGTWTEAMFNVMVRARMVSRRLKATDSDIRIIVGGNNRQEFTETIERVVLADLVKDFDEYAIDAYTGNWNMILGQHSIPELRLMEFYRLASNLSFSLGKGKVIRNDETGYAINYGARLDCGLAVEQAELTARTIIITRYAPVSRFELHRPADKQWFQETWPDDALCMTTCWKPFRFGKEFYHIPMPGGAMYATAASQLSFSKSLAEVRNGNIFCYMFQKPDGTVLVTLWNIAEEQRFLCEFPGEATAVNMLGRSVPVKNPTIGKAPIYITLKMPPAQAVELMRKAVLHNAPEFKCAATGSKVFIRSYASETRICRMSFPGLPERELRILPGKVTDVDIAATADGTLLAPDGRSYAIPLAKAETHTLVRLASRPTFDGSANWLQKLPSGSLQYPANIRPPEALQPERRYFRTSFNPEGHNISAQYWTAYDDEYFYLAVKVDDPIHQQRQALLEFWRDDSLQFVLSHEDGSSLLMEKGKEAKSEYNYGLALTEKGTRLVKYIGKDSGIKDYPAKVTRTGGVTFYEVAIPWKAIGGRARRFGFVLFDNNWQTMKSAPYYLAFSEGIAGGADDTRLKTLKYAE